MTGLEQLKFQMLIKLQFKLGTSLLYITLVVVTLAFHSQDVIHSMNQTKAVS